MSSSRSTRVLRGLVAAVFSTFVALLSHVAGGGAMPGWLGVLVPLVLSTFVCVLLAGRRRSLLRLTFSVAVSQLLFHTLFVLGAAPGASTLSSTGGHLAHGAPVSLDTAATPMLHGDHAGAGMWIAHVVAGIVTIVALHRAETLVSTLAAVKEFVLARLVPATSAALGSPVAPPRVRLRSDVLLPRPLAVHPDTTALRGPPALSVL